MFLYKISLSTSVCVPPLFIWQTPVSTPFMGCCIKRIFSHRSPVLTWCTLYCTKKSNYYQQFRTKHQHGKCRMRSFNFKMVLNNVPQLKHIQWGTTDIQSCPIKLPPLFRAPAFWVVPVWLIRRLMREWWHLYPILIEILQQNLLNTFNNLFLFLYIFLETITPRVRRVLSYSRFYIHKLLHQLIAVLYNFMISHYMTPLQISR